MADKEPNIVTSSLSRRVDISGQTLQVCIYKLEGTTEWSLEVVDETGSSTVWEDLFPTDDEANQEFLQTVAEEGIGAFIENTNVVPFPKR